MKIYETTINNQPKTSIVVNIPFQIGLGGNKTQQQINSDVAETLRSQTSNLFEIIQILGMAQAQGEDFDRYDFPFCLELLGSLGKGFQEAIEKLDCSIEPELAETAKA